MHRARQNYCKFGSNTRSCLALSNAHNNLPIAGPTLTCPTPLHRTLAYLTLSLSTLALSSFTLPAYASPQTPQKPAAASDTAAASNSASKTKLYGRIDKLASTIHGAGLKIESLTLPTRITDVRMGSPAFYGGVIKDDTIERMQINGDVLQIAIRRSGKLYGVALKTAPGTQPPSSPSSQPVSGPGSVKRTLQSQLSQPGRPHLSQPTKQATINTPYMKQKT